MCNLCSNDPGEVHAAKENAGYIADRLEKLAGLYRDFQHGKRKPHNDESIMYSNAAKQIIRELVEDWV